MQTPPPPTNPLPPSPPPVQFCKSSVLWFVTVHTYWGVPPSLWGTKSAVYPPLLALDSSHPPVNRALGA